MVLLETDGLSEQRLPTTQETGGPKAHGLLLNFQISMCDWLHLYLSQYLHCEIALHLYHTCHVDIKVNFV